MGEVVGCLEASKGEGSAECARDLWEMKGKA